MTDAVDARGLRHSYGEVRVLHGLNLAVEAGTILAVLGSSGCGKSTLLRLLAGFDRPDAGTISLAGTAVCDDATFVPAQRRPIGYVAQEGSLFPHMTVRRNLEFGLARRDRTATRVRDLLDAVSLDETYLERWPHELSGGQQQRVALARALARAPLVMLLVEPFTALDADLRASTRSAVAHALLDSGTTTILVTHDRAEALSFADNVAIMVAGSFTQVGRVRDVYQNPVDLTSARLVGNVVIVPGVVTTIDGDQVAQTPLGRLRLRTPAPDGPADILLRPEQVLVRAAHNGDATIAALEYFGHDHVLDVVWPTSGTRISARVSGPPAADVGQHVQVEATGTALAYPRPT